METILVAGAGTMGAGIALQGAHAGFDVLLIDPDPAALGKAKARVEQDAERLKDAACTARIAYYAAPPAQSGASLAIEAVTERADLKIDVLKALAASAAPDALIATNTSSLSVSDLADHLERPERVLGLHFFNPPTMMKLVEIVCAEQTGDEALARARSFVERMQRVPVIAQDTPGFIVNRVARPFYLQAMHAYEAGAAPLEDLDRLARGAGFRMGPFELMDLIGLDVNLATTQSVFERTDQERFEPVVLQQQMVAQGRLGRKTGSGFYDYSAGVPKHDDTVPQRAGEQDQNEQIVVVGYAGIALELREMLGTAFANVELWEDEDTLDQIPAGTTIVFDVGDGYSDRSRIAAELDGLLGEHAVIFVDAYATDMDVIAKRLMHPQRVVGYGILASLLDQNAVEIVDSEAVDDDALELAQEIFESIGRRVVLVENTPGLFLGRTIGSIVNEAVTAVEEGVAEAQDVDLAMRLGTNYPQGPIEWGREIGGARISRILGRLAAAEGAAFGPHRALYVLDVSEQTAVEEQQPDA